MKAFEEYKSKAEIKTIGYLTNQAAINAGRETGWRAALEWVRDEIMENRLTSEHEAIKKELEED